MKKTDIKAKASIPEQNLKIKWGRRAPIVDSKMYATQDLIINNRFDFGGDADILVRNIKPVEPQYKKSLFIFKNYIKKPKNDKNI